MSNLNFLQKVSLAKQKCADGDSIHDLNDYVRLSKCLIEHSL